MVDLVRCETCLGMGYKGRWRPSKMSARRKWKLETCRTCGGRGEREASKGKGGR